MSLYPGATCTILPVARQPLLLDFLAGGYLCGPIRRTGESVWKQAGQRLQQGLTNQSIWKVATPGSNVLRLIRRAIAVSRIFMVRSAGRSERAVVADKRTMSRPYCMPMRLQMLWSAGRNRSITRQRFFSPAALITDRSGLTFSRRWGSGCRAGDRQFQLC